MRMNARLGWRFWFVLYLQEMFGQILAQLTKKHSKIKQHHRSLAHPYGKWGTTEASQLEEGQGPPPPHPLTTLQASLPMSAISFCTFSNLIWCSVDTLQPEHVHSSLPEIIWKSKKNANDSLNLLLAVIISDYKRNMKEVDIQNLIAMA